MATDFKSIPLIDVSILLERCYDPGMSTDDDVLEVVKPLDKACREIGFFYVKGHGIPDSLTKEVRDVTHSFFHLPFEEKLKIKMSAKTGYRGYQRIGENITLGKPNMHEAIDVYTEIQHGAYGDLGTALEGSNMWPAYPNKFKALMEEYITLMIDLSRKIMRGVALALGGSPDAFEGDKVGDPFWVFRLIGYPAWNGNEMEDDVGWIWTSVTCCCHDAMYLDSLPLVQRPKEACFN